jgi:DNA-binding protein Fis
MKSTDGGSARRAVQAAAVISGSPLLRRRLAGPLQKLGLKVMEFPTCAAFSKARRQSPFVAVYLDTRGPLGAGASKTCAEARPAERYVYVRDSYDGWAGGVGEQGFGWLCEGFTPEEVSGWAKRALSEARLSGGERPLDELLYERFQSFLHHLGPTPRPNLHDLIWEQVERPLLTAVLEWTEGNQTRAAEALGIHRNTLRAKIRDLRIDLKKLS